MLHPGREPVPTKQSLPFLPLFVPAPGNQYLFLSISLDVSHKWNHRICGLFAGFTLVSSAALLATNHQVDCFEVHLSFPSSRFPFQTLTCAVGVLFCVRSLVWDYCPHRAPPQVPHRQPFLGLPVKLKEQQITFKLLHGFHILK